MHSSRETSHYYAQRYSARPKNSWAIKFKDIVKEGMNLKFQIPNKNSKTMNEEEQKKALPFAENRRIHSGRLKKKDWQITTII